MNKEILRKRLDAALMAEGYHLTDAELERVGDLIAQVVEATPEIVRVLKLVEFVGPREAIERQLSAPGALPCGTRRFGEVTCNTAIVNGYPEVLK